MNYIGIDPSLSCTGMTVNGKMFAYVTSKLALTKTGKLNKWFTLCEPFVEFRMHDLDSNENFSESEIGKLVAFAAIINSLIDDIMEFIDVSCETFVGIEGYSYSSDVGPLIDLVTFGTILRCSILDNVPNVTITIMPPSTLKLSSAKLTYPPIELGKKVKRYEWRNNEGVSGGSFKKHEMFKCLSENAELDTDWVEFLREQSETILSQKSVPKPIEDVNDSLLLYEIVKRINNN